MQLDASSASCPAAAVTHPCVCSQAIFWVLFNQTVVGVPCMAAFYRLLEARGYDSGRELPTFHWVLLEIAVCLLVEEVAFYYSHRYQ